MFKLFVLTALFAIAAARPGYLESSPLVYSAPTAYIQEPAYAKVGAIVKNIPTSVSHQSHAVVHGSTHYVSPIVTPVVKTYAAAAPVIKTYSAPLIHKTYAAAPIYKSYSVPSVHSYAAAAPVIQSYSPVTYGAAYGASYASPAHYSSW